MASKVKKPLTKRQREEAATRALQRAESEFSDSGRVFIELLSKKLGRSTHTIRQWIKRDDFPVDLLPQEEGGRKKMSWTEGQLEGLAGYAELRESQRGSFGRSTV